MRTRTPIAAIALISVSWCSGVLGELSRTAQQATQAGNRLLTEGSYSEAARAFGEAIGQLLPHIQMDQLIGRTRPTLVFELLQAGDSLSVHGEE